MRSEEKTHFNNLTDDDLLTVSGGCTIQNERGEEVKEGRFITSKLTNYGSGDAPKYAVGDFVKIKWHIRSDLEVLCNAEVVGISDGGLLFRKYAYSVKILSCPNSDMIGMVEPDVHENCLYL